MNMLQFRRCTLALGLAAMALLTGCAQIKLGAPVAGVDNIAKAKSSGIAPVAIGSFVLAPGKPPALDQSISVRSNNVYSPYDSSFAKYLQETLTADLRAAGLLDPASSVVIEGQLTDSQLDAAMSQGTGTVAARFIVKRAGREVYNRELRASGNWESSFVGAVAIPAAINEYTALYRKLVTALLDDPAFRAAAKR